MRTSNYDPIADEYYDPRHITSRNFDAATEAYFAKANVPCPRTGMVLELGAGRGSAVKYCRLETSRILQTDLSRSMLSLSPREPSRLKLQCDALELPFRDSSFSMVLAFLYDPYNTSPLYREVRRVLQAGGAFIGSLPHHSWGSTLRESLGYPSSTTKLKKFQSQDERLIELDSFLMTDDQIRTATYDAGLVILSMEDLILPKNVTEVSAHIQLPAGILGLTPYTLPIVKLIIARRPE